MPVPLGLLGPLAVTVPVLVMSPDVPGLAVKVTQVFPALASGQQDVQGFRRGHQNLRWMFQHGRSFARKSIAGSHSRADSHRQVAPL